jgi:hypothetical protein
VAHLAALTGRPTGGAGQPRLVGRGGQAAERATAASGPGRATEEGAMLVEHEHKPGVFDAGHCWVCARQAGLLAVVVLLAG